MPMPKLVFAFVPNKLKLVPEEEAVDPELELELAAEPDLCGKVCAISMSPAVAVVASSDPTPLDLARLFRSLPSPAPPVL